MNSICRDCTKAVPVPSAQTLCPNCASSRIISHPELFSLSTAHIDCDAFYAAVEKRDNPKVLSKPVIVGGGRRGVVAACCYIARINGVRSAMPIFEAMRRCPDAIIISPNMPKYNQVSQEIRILMEETTPLVEPLSIDEAFLDLSGTDKLHKCSPAQTLISLAKKIEQKVGITVSIGLSYNKFLAKVASDLNKPRGFAIIGKAETENFLRFQPIRLIWGVGKSFEKQLQKDGINSVGDLWRFDEIQLIHHYGAMGRRLFRFSRGLDDRTVSPLKKAKSISAETTFTNDICDLEDLKTPLWKVSESVAQKLKKTGLISKNITLKIRESNFGTVTRSRHLGEKTQLAEEIYCAAYSLLQPEVDGRPFRLIGVAATKLTPNELDQFNFSTYNDQRTSEVENVIDTVRARFGAKAIWKGRGWTAKKNI